MAKDPAILFYTSDFLTGTFTMTDEQVGRYIKLLCLQHQKGTLKLKDLEFICKGQDPEIFAKFENDGKGNYSNKTLTEHSEKRKAYSESRKKNRSQTKDMNNISKTYVPHMENEIENVIVNTNLNIGGAGGDIIEVFFKDLENSMAFESICRNLQITPDFLKTFIPGFRVKAELKYPSFDRFISHFKNYVTKEIKDATTKTTTGNRFSRQESVNELEELSLRVLNANDGTNG